MIKLFAQCALCSLNILGFSLQISGDMRCSRAKTLQARGCMGAVNHHTYLANRPIKS